MGAPLWPFDCTAAVLVEAWLASLGSSSRFLHKQKETSRKSSWLIQFPRISLPRGTRGQSVGASGKLNITELEEAMAQIKRGRVGVRCWQLLNSYSRVEISHPHFPRSHQSASWKTQQNAHRSESIFAVLVRASLHVIVWVSFLRVPECLLKSASALFKTW